MAWRLGDYVVSGELINLRRNSVHGWLDFGDDHGVRFDLAGNLSGELAGRHVRFAATPRPPTDSTDAPDLAELDMQQIGVVGAVSLKMVRVPRVPIDDFIRLSKLGEPPPTDEKLCLYLEWFSQNGRVVAEIVDPQIEYVTEDEAARPAVEPEPLPEQTGGEGPGIVGDQMDDEGQVHETDFTADEDDEEDDPYNLFPADFDETLIASNTYERPTAEPPDNEVAATELVRRSWDEVIPGIDPETKRMYEQWDEMVEGTNDVPLSTLFDPPIQLPPVDQLTDEKASELFNTLLARLALHRVALDMCEHFSPRDAYRYLVEEVLPEAHIYPNLPATGFIRHYSTWEHCPQCDAEFEAEYQARKKAEPNGSSPSDDAHDGDVPF